MRISSGFESSKCIWYAGAGETTKFIINSECIITIFVDAAEKHVVGQVKKVIIRTLFSRGRLETYFNS
jgi:hypothetical protein